MTFSPLICYCKIWDNDKGEILSFYLTKGNVDDRDVKVMKCLTEDIFGKLFGDKGYISQALFDLLFADGIQLITKVRKNMKQRNLTETEQILLRKRAVIETVNDELKNICKLQHTRHRSVSGFLFNVMATLCAYSFFPKKPRSIYKWKLLLNFASLLNPNSR